MMEDLGSANMGFSLVHDADARRGRGARSIMARTSCKRAWLPKLVTGEWTGDDEPHRAAGGLATSAR